MKTQSNDESRSRRELQGSEARYRALYENSFDGVLLTEPDGRILAANPAACRILGRAEEELRRLTRLDLINPGDPRTTVLVAERDKTGRYQGELEMVRGDGSSFAAEVASAVFATAQGMITSMIIRDVTDRIRAEARVKEQAQWLDIANEAIFAIDLDHRITYWNQGAERMGGRSATEMVGRRLRDLLTDAGVSDPHALSTADQMTDWRGTISCRHRSGTSHIVTASVTTLRNAHGLPTGRLCICTDITEQTQLKEKYERAVRLQSIGMLTAGIAHDFNNILTPISMSVSMLRARLSLQEDLELLEVIQTCAGRGAAVTRQILGFAQGVENQARAIQLKSILSEVADIVRETFPKSITLEMDIPSDLCPVMGNATQIHQVLLNLCVNARDAMPQGGRLRLGGRNCILDEKTAARIEGARKGAWLVLSIEDTGTGIAPDLLPRVWEPFFTTKSDTTGTGLGLSTVRNIVEVHGGFITVDTAAGRGTTFRVYLPAIASGSLQDEHFAPLTFSGGNGENILVVEDERGVREVIIAALAKAGYRVVSATNGSEALDLIKSHTVQIDLVITDIDMPVLNGAKLARATAGIRPDLPIMAMSGLSLKSDGVDPAQFSGGFLPKPFTMDELFRSVRQVLASKEPA